MGPVPQTSPPKRVTRARAAAKMSANDIKQSNMDYSQKPSTRKRGAAAVKEPIDTVSDAANPETLEPVRKSTRKGGGTAPARRIKITPLDSKSSTYQPPQQDIETHAPPEKKARTTRSTKAAVSGAETEPGEIAQKDAKSKRHTTQKATLKAEDQSKPAAPKVRGRPKKTQPASDKKPEGDDSRKVSGTRTGAGAASTRAMAKAPVRTAVSKKVTFQGVPECDKENQPMAVSKSSIKGQSAAPATGLRAKPVRRPTASSKTKSKDVPAGEAQEVNNHRVLTPKKVTQVSKSFSPVSSEEDELNGPKTPIRDLSQSPKRSVRMAGKMSPVKKLHFDAAVPTESHEKSQPASLLMSPAKRPAPSPYKDPLKESPRRGDILFMAPHMPNAKEDAHPGSQTMSNTLLLQSPKRAAINTLPFPSSPSRAAKSPSKASLLMSPPKRLPSPVKPSSSHQANECPVLPTPKATINVTSQDVMTPSHLEGTPATAQSACEHKATAGDEIAEETGPVIDFDQSIVDIRSPLKLEEPRAFDTCEAEVEPPRIQAIEDILDENSIVARGAMLPQSLNNESMSLEDTSVISNSACSGLPTTAPPCLLAREQMSVSTSPFLFHSSNARDDDESSDDELQSPARIPPSETPTIVTAADANPGFTPLADQLKGWLASSPAKKSNTSFEERSKFSPVAAQHVPGEVVIDRHSPAASRVSTESRSTTSARKSMAPRKSVASARNSLARSMVGTTPDKSTYFANEMAVKDLEDEIEGVHAMHREANVLQVTTCTELAGEIEIGNAEYTDSEIQDENDRVGLSLMVSDVPGQSSIEPDVANVVEEPSKGTQEPRSSQDVLMSCISDDENAVPRTSSPQLEKVNTATAQKNTQAPVSVPAFGGALVNQQATPCRPSRPISQLAKTVVSKVPLRPEGDIRPAEGSRKRSRSLSAGHLPVKRIQTSPAGEVARHVTTHASLGQAQSVSNSPAAAAITPDQRSFVIDDFGDSTLDGIEIDADDENVPPASPTDVANVTLSSTMPSETPKALTLGPANHVLQGAVVYVDVHTTEGADASGIFTELLNQMGAKCVKTWSWNPRASMGASGEDTSMESGGCKIGITHVVFKDGGMRTLEKVRDTEGVVKCVGVGWVLDCEREKKWLDESVYAVDISILPRGGSRRRKSMEPRALWNINGNLTKKSSSAAGRRSFSAEMTQQMKRELIQTPVRGRSASVEKDIRKRGRESESVEEEAGEEETEQPFKQQKLLSDSTANEDKDEESGFTTLTGLSQSPYQEEQMEIPAATPTGFVAYDPTDPAFQTPAAISTDTMTGITCPDSPTTPSYPIQGANLIQMTCPPKQTRQGLFSTSSASASASSSSSSRIFPTEHGQDEPTVEMKTDVLNLHPVGGGGARNGNRLLLQATERDRAVQKRLADARRRTLGWKPKVGSPLRRYE